MGTVLRVLYSLAKYAKTVARILGIKFSVVIVFIIALFIIQNLRSNHQNIAILSLPETFHSSFASCQLIKTNEQRCYPLLINFAHGCCKREQKNNCLTGLQHGIRQCIMLDKQILHNYPNFISRNKSILERKRGAGYWLWKPFLIFHELYLAQDGDIIIYSDALVDFVGNISYLIKLTEEQDIIVFRLSGTKVS